MLGVLQRAPGAVAVGLVGERHPVRGRVEHGRSLQPRGRGFGQPEALGRSGSVVVSIGHKRACLSRPHRSVAPLPDETMAAVAFVPPSPHATAPNLQRLVAIRWLWSRRSEARTPSTAAPAPSGLTSGSPFLIVLPVGGARLRTPELRARKHMVRPRHGRAAAI